MKPFEVAQLIQHFFEEKKVEETLILNLEDKQFIVDYMVVGTAMSGRQVQAAAEFVYQELKQRNIYATIEGISSQSDWILIDAGDVIAHLFKPEARSFYNLEKMWGDYSSFVEKENF